MNDLAIHNGKELLFALSHDYCTIHSSHGISVTECTKCGLRGNIRFTCMYECSANPQPLLPFWG